MCPPPLRPAGRWQKSIVALTLLLLAQALPPSFPPPAPGAGAACRAGRSIRSQLPSTQQAAWFRAGAYLLRLSSCFCPHPQSLYVANRPCVPFISGPLLEFSSSLTSVLPGTTCSQSLRS